MPALYPLPPPATPPLPPLPAAVSADEPLNRVSKAPSRWAVGILASLCIYFVALVAAAFAPRYLAPGGALEIVVAVVPMLAALLVVGIVFVAYLASDDAVRQRILKCAALTGVIMAFSTLGYFCLEILGHARLSMIVVNLYGWAVFTVMMLWVLSRAR